jgi:hypothetical protein
MEFSRHKQLVLPGMEHLPGRGRFEGPVGREAPHPDEDITVYHTTTPEGARHLQHFGTTRTKPVGKVSTIQDEKWASALGKTAGDALDFEPGRGMGSGLYVTRHPGEGTQYGSHTVPVRIKAGDLSVPPERAHREGAGMTAWKSLNVQDGYVHGVLQPHQFGDVYTKHDWEHWDNQHG